MNIYAYECRDGYVPDVFKDVRICGNVFIEYRKVLLRMLY